MTKKSDRTRTAITEAARQLFRDRGYERTTVRDIAAAAEVDPALVIRYFGSKDQLFAHSAEIRLDFPDMAALPRDEIGAVPTTIAIDTVAREAAWFSLEGAESVSLAQPLVRPIPQLTQMPAWMEPTA